MVVEPATPAELLAFGNSFRKAAGVGRLLELPRNVSAGQPFSCLVARTLHFECAVAPADAGSAWIAYFTDSRLARRIAKALGLYTLPPKNGTGLEIVLPYAIGEAAAAFDRYDYKY